MSVIGNYRKQPKGFNAFIPNSFPPTEEIAISRELSQKHTEAVRLVGKLDGITELLPDKDYFLEMFVRKDASSSSQIEGTKATMMDAIEAANIERGSDLPDDVDDILHYINALNFGLKRAKELPLSLRLIQELHEKLMTDARSTHNAYPGEFRRSQNWIGGTRPDNARFVPPPVHEMKQALGELENFVYGEDNYPPLIKAGLIHAQFETIHPFADGNGRTGRMLVTMYLWQLKLLEMPLLYLSAYFKQHQDAYYERLNGYHSKDGHIDRWLDFFMDGLIDTAKSAITTCQKITALREEDMRKVQQLGRVSAPTTIEVLRNLYRLPTVGVADIAEWTGFTRPGAYKMIDRLVKMEILSPIKEPGSYGQKYTYRRYVELFTDESNEKEA
ncbi:MAG TPA: Fic family protein [Candidatus Saccharimonadia bacterium]|nr:Fic family protein [Candidatus Saccharimonadia bacterium]